MVACNENHRASSAGGFFVSAARHCAARHCAARLSAARRCAACRAGA
jgi:hypothetical protein